MTATLPTPGPLFEALREHVVTTDDLVGVPPAVLSCRLHEAVAAADTGAVVVAALGRHAGDPALARVLSCAAASAASRGIGFTLR